MFSLINTRQPKDGTDHHMKLKASYCTVKLGDVTRQTPLRNNLQQWNVAFEFDVANINTETEKLIITLWNWGQGMEDFILGELRVPLNIFDADSTPKWFPVTPSTSTAAGEILLSFSFV